MRQVLENAEIKVNCHIEMGFFEEVLYGRFHIFLVCALTSDATNLLYNGNC